MSGYDVDFTVGQGRAADAVEFLVANSALQHLATTKRGDFRELIVTAPRYASSGEHVLWSLAKDIGGAPGLSASVTDLADRLDGPNLAAAYAAIGMALGLRMTMPAVTL